MSDEMPLDELRRNIVVLDSTKECLEQAEAVLITTPDPAFRALTAADFKNEWSEVLVMDFWRLLKDQLRGQSGIRYVAIGNSVDDTANEQRLKQLWWGADGKSLVSTGE
jgi:hypothetical protein